MHIIIRNRKALLKTIKLLDLRAYNFLKVQALVKSYRLHAIVTARKHRQKTIARTVNLLGQHVFRFSQNGEKATRSKWRQREFIPSQLEKFGFAFVVGNDYHSACDAFEIYDNNI